MSEPLLQVADAVKRFGGRVALDGAHCSVAAGSITGMIGPNGSGKSTLFNCIAGTDRLDSGSVLLQGRPIDRLAPHAVCERGIARTFQLTRLFRDMTVLENLVAVAHGFSDRQAVERARHALDLLEISELMHRPASELSYGQRKLVEIGRTLMLEPKLMLLDEPFAGINPRLQNRIVGYLQTLRDQGMTLFIIDHEMRIILEVCETVWVLAEGRIVTHGAPAVVRDDPRVLEAYF
jgi:branched-chain amino acid transport system ATP-binding protein